MLGKIVFYIFFQKLFLYSRIFVSSKGVNRMQLATTPFMMTNWDSMPATVHSGNTGEALWRTLNIGDVRVRMVEYTAGYVADHWCDKGHILFVLSGELETKLKDGRTFNLVAGMSYQVSDFGDSAHLSSSKEGAKLFIVD